MQASKTSVVFDRSLLSPPTHPSVPEQSRLHTECVGQDREGVYCRKVGYIHSVGQDREGVYCRKVGYIQSVGQDREGVYCRKVGYIQSVWDRIWQVCIAGR